MHQPPPHRRPLDALAVGILVLLCASWGLQQVSVKLALPSFPPMTQMALRSAGACLLVLLWCRASGVRLTERDGTLWWGVLAGALFGTEFALIYVGLQWTGASRTAIFLYTSPFFVALGASVLLPGERMGPLQWAGLCLSFAGVVIALGMPAVGHDSWALLGDTMVLGAGLLWAATTLVIKASRLRACPPEKVLLYQLGVSGLMAAVLAAAFREHATAAPTPMALLSMAYQTLWVAGITYVLWFRLLARYPAGPLQAGTSMSPLFGVASAALVLGEPLTPALALSAALLVSGLLLVNRPGRSKAVAPAMASSARNGRDR